MRQHSTPEDTSARNGWTLLRQNGRLFAVMALVAAVPALVAFLGEAPARARNVSAAAGSGTAAETPAADSSTPVALPGPDRQVDADDVIHDIVKHAYSSRRDVAAGRFLSDFARQARELRRIDTSAIRRVSASATSVRVEAPYRPRSPDGGSVPAPGRAQIRLVRTPAGWRVEHVRILSRRAEPGAPRRNTRRFYESLREVETMRVQESRLQENGGRGRPPRETR